MAGIECYYPLHDEATVAHCLALADKYALVPTGGSDYHGSMKPDAHLGVGSAGLPLPDDSARRSGLPDGGRPAALDATRGTCGGARTGTPTRSGYPLRQSQAFP